MVKFADFFKIAIYLSLIYKQGQVTRVHAYHPVGGIFFGETTQRRSRNRCAGVCLPTAYRGITQGFERVKLWAHDLELLSCMVREVLASPTLDMTRDQDTLAIQRGRTLALDLPCQPSIYV